ncbi:polysaccharide pyruvyl transferase family protein [candidate division KSB1 bacterium]|nr:polysaccharide pyruvyl transferase family protein [candidate division KSB1 bacterium]
MEKQAYNEEKIKVLMVGYNGANNTGAEALLMSDIEDVKAVFGSKATITVPTIHGEANLRRYIKEGPQIKIQKISSIFFSDICRLVKKHDLIMLVEGSTYMDTWTSALLWAFLWTTYCADRLLKPILAYAVDAGSLKPANQRRVQKHASRTNQIIVRSSAAAERLKNYGVTAPIEATADNAFNFQPAPNDQHWLQKEWPEANSGIVGFSVVDFHLWPVVAKLWGPSTDCYKWPYYYSRSPERTLATEKLATMYANLADLVIEKYQKNIALIAMEQLDEPLARQIQQRMKNPAKARIFSSRVHQASQMTVLLRSLDLLVTSRYHACVLSLAQQVPQIAIGHDLRLRTIYEDLNLHENYFLDPHDPYLSRRLTATVEELLADSSSMRTLLWDGFQAHLARAQQNRELLRQFVLKQGWEVPPVNSTPDSILIPAQES